MHSIQHSYFTSVSLITHYEVCIPTILSQVKDGLEKRREREDWGSRLFKDNTKKVKIILDHQAIKIRTQSIENGSILFFYLEEGERVL